MSGFLNFSCGNFQSLMVVAVTKYPEVDNRDSRIETPKLAIEEIRKLLFTRDRIVHRYSKSESKLLNIERANQITMRQNEFEKNSIQFCEKLTKSTSQWLSKIRLKKENLTGFLMKLSDLFINQKNK